jgi:hypothetical protein
MDMLELKRAFATGQIHKDVYCQLMYEKHVLLEQYCNLIKETLIKK